MRELKGISREPIKSAKDAKTDVLKDVISFFQNSGVEIDDTEIEESYSIFSGEYMVDPARNREILEEKSQNGSPSEKQEGKLIPQDRSDKTIIDKPKPDLLIDLDRKNLHSVENRKTQELRADHEGFIQLDGKRFEIGLDLANSPVIIQEEKSYLLAFLDKEKKVAPRVVLKNPLDTERKVNDVGWISIDGKPYYVSKSLAGKLVVIQESEDNEHWIIFPKEKNDSKPFLVNKNPETNANDDKSAKDSRICNMPSEIDEENKKKDLKEEQKSNKITGREIRRTDIAGRFFFKQKRLTAGKEFANKELMLKLSDDGSKILVFQPDNPSDVVKEIEWLATPKLVDDSLRRVSKIGYISIDNKAIFVGLDLIGKTVKIKKVDGSARCQIIPSNDGSFASFEVDLAPKSKIQLEKRKITTDGTIQYEKNRYFVGLKHVGKEAVICESHNGTEIKVYLECDLKSAPFIFTKDRKGIKAKVDTAGRINHVTGKVMVNRELAGNTVYYKNDVESNSIRVYRDVGLTQLIAEVCLGEGDEMKNSRKVRADGSVDFKGVNYLLGKELVGQDVLVESDSETNEIVFIRRDGVRIKQLKSEIQKDFDDPRKRIVSVGGMFSFKGNDYYLDFHRAGETVVVDVSDDEKQLIIFADSRKETELKRINLEKKREPRVLKKSLKKTQIRSAERTVSAYGGMNFEGNSYFIGKRYAGKRMNISKDPTNNSLILSPIGNPDEKFSVLKKPRDVNKKNRKKIKRLSRRWQSDNSTFFLDVSQNFLLPLLLQWPEEKIQKLFQERQAGKPITKLSTEYEIPYDELQELFAYNKVHPKIASLDEVKGYIGHYHSAGRVLSDNYVNVFTPVKIDCGRGHMFEITPVSLYMGRWCQECFDEGHFKSEVACKAIIENIFGQAFNKNWPEWLKNEKGIPLHLDMVNSQPINLGKYRAIAIEYNGEQHYKWIKRFHPTFEEFINQQKNDRQKRELCRDNGILLIEIPYTVKMENVRDFIVRACKLHGIEHPGFYEGFSFKRFIHNSVGYDLLSREIDRDKQIRYDCRAFSMWLNEIARGRIPDSIFQNNDVPRASRMKIKDIAQETKHQLVDELVGMGAIVKDPPFWKETSASFQAITGNKPSHEVMLNWIFRNNKSIIAKELPVWREDRKLTGHLDLLGIRETEGLTLEITVLDYKPEGEAGFLRSIPQVACYAKMIEDRLPASKRIQVRCIIFDKFNAWSFSPSIIKDLVERLPREVDTNAWESP